MTIDEWGQQAAEEGGRSCPDEARRSSWRGDVVRRGLAAAAALMGLGACSVPTTKKLDTAEGQGHTLMRTTRTRFSRVFLVAATTLAILMSVLPLPAGAADEYERAAAVTINFDDLKLVDGGVVVSTQYPEATFSSTIGHNLLIRGERTTDSRPYYICPLVNEDSELLCRGDTIVSFASPVDSLSFKAIHFHMGDSAQVDVYENGAFSTTVTIVGQGITDPVRPGLQDLSAYHDVTKIVIRPDSGNTHGIGWDDFVFVTGSPSPSPQPCDAPAANEVVIYEHVDHAGRCVVKGVGTYDSPVAFGPLPDDSASSIRVGSDVVAALASEIGLGGDVERFTGDVADFSDTPITGGEPIGDDRMSSFKVYLPLAAACADGTDNDGDGLVDYLAEEGGDPGCESAGDPDETDVPTACNDGADNDGDGLVDFSTAITGDPGCESGVDNDEANVVLPPGDCPGRSEVKSDDGVLAAIGCFVADGTRYLATGEVRVNGIDLATSGTVSVDPLNLRVTATGMVLVKAGDVVLYSGPVDWSLARPLALHLPSGSSMFGFPINGSAAFSWEGGASKLELTVTLPAVFAGFTGKAALVTDNAAGLRTDLLGVTVARAPLGPFAVKDLTVTYKPADDAWSGGGTLVYPTGYEFTLGATMTRGELTSANVGVGGLNMPLSPGLYLQSLDAMIQTEPHILLSGSVGLSAGPKLPTIGYAASLTGKVTLESPQGVNKISATGDVKFGESLTVASGTLTADSTGSMVLGGQLSIGNDALGVFGEVEGSIGEEDFYLKGSVSLRVLGLPALGGTGRVSTRGMAACAWLADIEVGVGYRWGGEVEFGGCDLGQFREPPLVAGAGAAPSYNVEVGEGVPGAAVAVTGDGAAPAFTLRGPAGEVIVANPRHYGVTPDGRLVGADAKANTTYVVVAAPSAGTWTIEPHDGSATITRIRQADALPKPDVTGSVTAADANNPACLCTPGDSTLTWKLTPISGQSVTFVEEGPGGSRVIGTATAADGSLTFTPGPGGEGERRIVAVVDQDGLPRADVPVATYQIRD